MVKSALNGIAPLLPIAAGEVMGMNSSAIGSFLIGAAAVAVLINQIVQAQRSFRTKPVGMEINENCALMHSPIIQRLDALEKDELSARHEMNERLAGVSSSFTSLRQEIKADMTAASTQAKVSDKNLHDRMNEVLRIVSELRGAFEQSQRRKPS